jgi:hypothetical protein
VEHTTQRGERERSEDSKVNDQPPCPKSYDDADDDDPRTCGADEWNAKIDKVLGG